MQQQWTPLAQDASHDLAITNTMFHLPTRNKISWMHPRSRHWHLIDNVIVRARDRWDVRLTKAMCGADCWTDHRLIISKLNLHIQPMRRPQGQKVAKRLNITKLKCIQTTQKLHRAVDSKLADTQSNQDSIKEQWAPFRDCSPRKDEINVPIALSAFRDKIQSTLSLMRS